VWLICPPLVPDVNYFIIRAKREAEWAEKRVELWAGVAETAMEQSGSQSERSWSGNGAGSGVYRNRLEREVVFSPLTLCSHAPCCHTYFIRVKRYSRSSGSILRIFWTHAWRFWISALPYYRLKNSSGIVWQHFKLSLYCKFVCIHFSSKYMNKVHPVWLKYSSTP